VTKTWIETADDVLEALDALLCYLSPDRQKCRNAHRFNRRPLYPLAIKRAARLLHVRGTELGDMGYWYLGKRWPQRLELAGIDPQTLEVVDQRRWAHAWEQLSTENTFRQGDQRRKINSDREPPPLEPVERVIYCGNSKRSESPLDDNTVFGWSGYGNGYG
jgi:hypothetical protein